MSKQQNSRIKWLKERREGIGGSDVAAILGLSPWTTPYDVWRSKTGEVLEDQVLDTACLKAGRKLEDVVRTWYEEETGFEVEHFNPPRVFHHKENPLWLGTPDGLVHDHVDKSDGILEIKTTNPSHYQSYWEYGEAPEWYWVQLQHYMHVLARPWADIAVLVGGTKFETSRQEPNLRVYYDEEWIEYTYPQLEQWWHKHVVLRIPPELTSKSDVLHKYPTARVGAVAKASPEAVQAWRALLDVKAEMKRLRLEQKKHEELIQIEMQDAEALVHEGNTLCTFKTQRPLRYLKQQELKGFLQQPVEQLIGQLETMKDSMVTLYDLYSYEKTGRMFLPKKVKRAWE